MSNDMLGKLRALAEKRKARNASENYFKPEYGETQIRFLPAKDGKSVFFKEFGEHWVDKKRYVCPKLTLSKRCPICEAVNELYNQGDEESKNLARQFKVRKQHYANVIVRGKEDEGPKVYKFGIKLANRIVDDCLDEDRDISNPETGMDYRVIKQKLDGFPNYDRSKPVKHPSTLDEDDFKAWMESAEDVHTKVLSEVTSYEEIQAEFAGVDIPDDVTKGVDTEEFDEDDFLNRIENAVGE